MPALFVCDWLSRHYPTPARGAHMRTVILRRGLVALFAAAVALGAVTQAQAEDLRIGYQKYGTLVLLKAKGSLEKRLAEQGVKVQWTEFPGGP
ncbi:Sulfonate ABC transporter periplasmic sulfonate-binding protein SsuA, partial [Pseudomonas savastanoi pv. glycinea]